MAQLQVVRLLDDLDGSEADESVSFMLDGKFYDIDLSKVNAERLRGALKEFIGAARKGGHRPTARPQQPAKPSGMTREEGEAIRTWARANGYKVSDRGRIPTVVLEAHRTDTPNPDANRTVSYAEARSSLVQDGANLVGKTRRAVAELFESKHKGVTVSGVEESA